MELLKQQLEHISTDIDLLKSKDVRDVKDAIRILSSKIDRLNPQGEQSESVAHISEALAKATLEKKPLKESGTGNRGKYSTLEDYEDAYEAALAKHGIKILFQPDVEKKILVAKLTHSSGEWFRSTLPLDPSEAVGPNKNEGQSFGSSLSYMKRYAYAAMMGV